jgi:3-hydroxyisobutyrate dehydrogenase-like beta-hydroxyacid dehydrogenase
VGEDRVRIAQSAGQVALEADIIITNLASDEVVKAIYQEFAQALEVRACAITTIGI